MIEYPIERIAYWPVMHSGLLVSKQIFQVGYSIISQIP